MKNNKYLILAILLVCFNGVFSQVDVKPNYTKPYFQGNVRIQDTLGVDTLFSSNGKMVIVDSIGTGGGGGGETPPLSDVLNVGNTANQSIDMLLNPLKYILESGTFIETTVSGTESLSLQFPDLTGNRNQSFQDKDGVIALKSDVDDLTISDIPNLSDSLANAYLKDGIYGGSGTAPSSTNVNITDTLTFGSDLLVLDETNSEITIETTLLINNSSNDLSTLTLGSTSGSSGIVFNSGYATPSLIYDRSSGTFNQGLVFESRTDNFVFADKSGDIAGSTIFTGALSQVRTIESAAVTPLIIRGGTAPNDLNDGVFIQTADATNVMMNRFYVTADATNVNAHFTNVNGVHIGSALPPTAKLHVEGSGVGSGKSFLIENAVGTDNFTVLDNGGVGIGVSSPDPSAALDIQSTTKGLLLPRMTAAQASAIVGVDGLVIYVTDTDATFTAQGFWGYDNGVWIQF